MNLHHNYMACIFTMDDEKEEGYIFIWYNYIVWIIYSITFAGQSSGLQFCHICIEEAL